MKWLQNLEPKSYPKRRAEHIVFPYAVEGLALFLALACCCGVSRTTAKALGSTPVSLIK
jgi:hypothetical protein